MVSVPIPGCSAATASWHLRVTILPQCNLRCRYCNPHALFQHSDTLGDDEIVEIVAAAVDCGINRIHWTGGEPCIRNVVSLFRRSKELGVAEQVMTTNGTLRLEQIAQMKDAGLSRVNVSLDSLSPERNLQITGRRHIQTTLGWIEQACQTFDQPTKMNIVPMSDNVHEIPNLISFAQRFSGKLMLKFIELCPNNPAFYGSEIQAFAVTRDEIVRHSPQ